MALTIDGSDPTGDLGDLLASKLDATAPVGKILQLVSATKTDTFTTTSSTYTDLTGLSVSITPTSATSTILVRINVTGGNSNGTTDSAAHLQILRDSTAIAIGDAASNRTQSTTGLSTRSTYTLLIMNAVAEFLDSPATTSALVYKVQVRAAAGTVYINRTEGDPDAATAARTTSTITVMEVSS